MPDIYVTFKNHYGESRRYVIWDTGRDPNSPPVVFDNYLDKDQVTDWLAIHSDGWGGKVLYQRSDGPQEVVENISDQSNVDMS